MSIFHEPRHFGIPQRCGTDRPAEPAWKTAAAGIGLVLFFVALYVAYIAAVAANERYHDCARGDVHTFLNCGE